MKCSGVIQFKSKQGSDDGFIFSFFGMLDGQTDILRVITIIVHERLAC